MAFRKSKAQEKYDKTKGLCSISYAPTSEEKDAYDYCVKNDIRISPVAIGPGMMNEKWYVGISTPENYKKVYKSKFQYDNEQIWPAVYEMCLYYFNKK